MLGGAGVSWGFKGVKDGREGGDTFFRKLL